MAWKVLSPEAVCNFLDFWRAQTWPMSPADARALGVREFGWTLEVEDDEEYAMAYDHGLTIPDVTTSSLRGDLANLGLWVSDVIRDVTPESTAFLGDNFTLMVREGTSRWGKPAMKRGERQSATWQNPGGSETVLSLSDKAINADLYTPQTIELDRQAGYR